MIEYSRQCSPPLVSRKRSIAIFEAKLAPVPHHGQSVIEIARALDLLDPTGRVIECPACGLTVSASRHARQSVVSVINNVWRCVCGAGGGPPALAAHFFHGVPLSELATAQRRQLVAWVNLLREAAPRRVPQFRVARAVSSRPALVPSERNCSFWS